MIKYYRAQSAVHSLGAKTKIACLAAITILALALPFEFAALTLALGLIALAASRVPVREFGWKTIFTAGAIVFAVRALFDVQPLAMGGITLPKGVYYGILNALYLSGIFLLAEVAIKTTKPNDFASALRELGLGERKSTMFSIALQAVPLFQDKIKRVEIAQKTRGNGKSVFPLVIPVMHSLFQKANKMAIALEARGFDPERKA